MKIKLLSIALIFSAALMSCNQTASDNSEENAANDNAVSSEAKDIAINLDESKVSWTGSMLGIYDHTGDVNITDASLSVADGKVTSGSFTVDLNSIVTTDDDALYKMAPREKLVEHLKADDFFHVSEYPTSTFVVKSMEGNTITGDLTIRGITHEEKVTDVVISEEGGQMTATGTMVFGRKKYDVKYETGAVDRVLSDDIELKISLAGSAM